MSLPLSDTVDISITQDSVGVQRAGFGVPMLLSGYAAFAERIRYYSSLSEVAADFATTTSPEYLFATRCFAGSNPPDIIAIGRSALPATMVYTLSTSAIRNSHAYVILVKGKSVTPTTVSITSGVSATNDDVCAALVTALNAVVGNNYLAAVVAGGGDTDTITVTADAAGGWFSLEVNPADLYSTLTHADPGVATDLAAIALEDNSWYALYTCYNSDAYVKAAAMWVESAKKIYMVDSSDTEAILTTSNGTRGLLDDLKTLDYARTATIYHPSPADMAGAAWLGKCLPYEPGEETWKFKPLVGVNPVTLTSTHRTNLRARNANSFETSSGNNMTWQGTMVDGGFIDTTRNLDWVEDDMGASVMEVFLGAAKVPFSNLGIAMLTNAMRASLKRAVSRGIAEPDFTVTYPDAADVSDANKASRICPDLKFSFTLTGAVHSADVTGVVSV